MESLDRMDRLRKQKSKEKEDWRMLTAYKNSSVGKWWVTQYHAASAGAAAAAGAANKQVNNAVQKASDVTEELKEKTGVKNRMSIKPKPTD